MGSGTTTTGGSLSGGSRGKTSGASYVEFFMDFSKYDVAPGLVVQSVVAGGRTFTPQPIVLTSCGCGDP
jgi:hypothetical protein